MDHDRQSEPFRGGKCLDHEPRVRGGDAVVRKPDGSRRGERIEIDQHLTIPTDGDGGNRMDRDEPVLVAFARQPPNRLDRIERRCCVGHASDRGETAGGCGCRAGGDRLLMLLTGHAEVDMHVDPAGAYDISLAITFIRPFDSLYFLARFR